MKINKKQVLPSSTLKPVKEEESSMNNFLEERKMSTQYRKSMTGVMKNNYVSVSKWEATLSRL